eukprot:CAMPEP_0201250290 /NCGR_PEP_ID=MMETSP0852-20130820/63016_1 /ASSEMBLY_ACC=CAM_ASM_000632 /TAXON_ID=183588 /ORGANISM="Pseudo-nitzschia fraudulenta, Strain WWA7" /LENGTH=49 /DNA_ID= /DNA_START= /DNA_END= /DNA_ORIENTATION=
MTSWSPTPPACLYDYIEDNGIENAEKPHTPSTRSSARNAIQPTDQAMMA